MKKNKYWQFALLCSFLFFAFSCQQHTKQEKLLSLYFLCSDGALRSFDLKLSNDSVVEIVKSEVLQQCVTSTVEETHFNGQADVSFHLTHILEAEATRVIDWDSLAQRKLSSILKEANWDHYVQNSKIGFTDGQYIYLNESWGGHIKGAGSGLHEDRTVVLPVGSEYSWSGESFSQVDFADWGPSMDSMYNVKSKEFLKEGRFKIELVNGRFELIEINVAGFEVTPHLYPVISANGDFEVGSLKDTVDGKTIFSFRFLSGSFELVTPFKLVECVGYKQ